MDLPIRKLPDTFPHNEDFKLAYKRGQPVESISSEERARLDEAYGLRALALRRARYADDTRYAIAG
jgi:hypothetical protein